MQLSVIEKWPITNKKNCYHTRNCSIAWNDKDLTFVLLETSGVNITTPNHLAAYFYFLRTYLEGAVTKIHHYYLLSYHIFFLGKSLSYSCK